MQVFKIIQSIGDILMESLFDFSDSQTYGGSKKLKKPRVTKSFRFFLC